MAVWNLVLVLLLSAEVVGLWVPDGASVILEVASEIELEDYIQAIKA
jgi:hypothetical protein